MKSNRSINESPHPGGACMRTTSPLITSPPRKQSPIFTLSLSVARTSCTLMTPVNSSPGGRGIPSTTAMDTVACIGDKRVTIPSTIEFGVGGCGRTRLIDSVWYSSRCSIIRRLFEILVNTDRRLIDGCSDQTSPYLTITRIDPIR